jgi:glycosyltransferase involved in cell wall biosynthesis
VQILLANKFFFEKGGAEKSLFETARLLQAHGHGTRFFAMQHARNLPCADARHFVSEVDYEDRSLRMRLKAGARMLYSLEAARKLAGLLDDARIDIAHLNNIYHQLSPSILRTLHRRGVPMVMSLRDYKVVCGSYQMLAQDRPCEACRGGRHLQASLKRCVKDSLAASVLTTVEMTLHHRILDLYGLVDLFISPSAFLKDKVREMGFPGEVVHLPNFVGGLAEVAPQYGSARARLVYSGRLGREKGLATLMRAAKGLPLRLEIIGEGPMREPLEALARQESIGNVEFTGYLSGALLQDHVRAATAVVVPSQWYENNPRSVIEAFALGKPVIGARIGGIPELVRHGDTGLTFTPGDVQALRGCIDEMLAQPARAVDMGRRGRHLVETELSPERHYARLMQVYERAIARHRPRADGRLCAVMDEFSKGNEQR